MRFTHLSMFCQNCGESISEEVAFCRSCGTALTEAQVQTNINRVRKETPVHISVHGEDAPKTRRIAGAIIIGFLELLFVSAVFVVSLIISINFLPNIDGNRPGSLFTYCIVMATTFVAGLVGGAYFSKKFCEKFPNFVAKFKEYLCFEERRA